MWLFRYPFYDEASGVQRFPFRTFAMILSAIFIIIGTQLSKFLFLKEILPPSLDILQCVVNIPEDIERVGDPIEGETIAMTTQVYFNKISDFKFD